MVLVGVLSAGVNLAVQAYADRKSPSIQDNGGSGDGTENEHQETGIISAASVRKHEEAEAFQELQHYADFQEQLSGKVLKQIEDFNSTPYGLLSNSFQEFSLYGSSQEHTDNGKLQCPIVIKRQEEFDGATHWARAYPPPLVDAGIDQHRFLSFLDSLDQYIMSSPHAEAMNFASLNYGKSFDVVVSKAEAVSRAAGLPEFEFRKYGPNSFLADANATLFLPSGLVAILITSAAQDPSPVVVVELHNQLPSSPRGLNDPHFEDVEMDDCEMGPEKQHCRKEKGKRRGRAMARKMGDIVTGLANQRRPGLIERRIRRLPIRRHGYGYNGGASAGFGEYKSDGGADDGILVGQHGDGHDVSWAGGMMKPGCLYLVITNAPDKRKV